MKLSPIQSYRKSLLPTWLKVFCWIFFVVLIFSLFFGVVLFTGGDLSLMIYGLAYSGSAINAYAIMLWLFFMLMGLSGYALIWGQKWGIYIGIIQGLIGIFVPIVVLILALLNQSFTIPIELILFIPWTIKLFKIKNKWLANNIPVEVK